MIFLLTGLLLWLLAASMKYSPERMALLLWGKRRRAVLKENGTIVLDRQAAAKELKIIGMVLLLKNLLDYLLWTFFNMPHSSW